MSAPSTFQASTHDNRTETDVDILPVLVEWAEGQKPTRHREGVFVARHASRCASCPGWVTPGDEAQYGIDDQLEHVACPDELEVGPKGVCSVCYLEMPLSGICGVC